MRGASRGRAGRAGLHLRLFVAGNGPNSLLARQRLEKLLAALDPGEWQLEVVDVLLAPSRALEERVVVTPTLVRLVPPPRQVIVGNLADAGSVAEALGLQPDRGPAEGKSPTPGESE